MHQIIEFLLRHGYAALFLNVMAEEMGLPIPAVPMLLTVGALVADHKLSFWPALLLAVVGSLISDSVWYQLGRRQGQAILGVLCKLSLEPDYCITRTKNVFGRFGETGLLYAKFLPGVNSVATPMAGVTKMPRVRFLLMDGAGATLWGGTYLLLGALFHQQLEEAAAWITRLGSVLGIIVLTALVLYVVFEIYRRRKFLRELRLARITPEEVKGWMDRGDPLAIVDLRHGYDIDHFPHQLPGAIRMTSEELELRHDEIPRDREVVLYCS